MVAQQFSTAHVLVLFTHATGDSDKQLFRMERESPGFVGISCEHSLQPMAISGT